MIKNKEIQKIKNIIAKEYNPEKIILFGSSLYDVDKKDSDIDLMIIKKTRKKILDRRRDLAKKLFGKNFPPIDILIYTPEEVKKRLDLNDIFLLNIKVHPEYL